MSRWFESKVIWGVLLILGGVFLLLANLGIINVEGDIWELLVGGAMAVGGLVFLTVYLSNHTHWWALIPGFSLLGIGSLVVLSSLLPGIADRIGGPLVLGSISLAFLTIYLTNRDNWWALIPGGVLLTLTLISALPPENQGVESGAMFFLGLGLTFALVALAPTPEGRMHWAWIPAGILLAMGVLIFLAAEELINLLWPVALIAGGLFLFYQAYRSGRLS